MSNGSTYPAHPRSKVNRYRTIAVYDYDFIHSVVDQSRVVHVAFPADPNGDDPFPAVLPMIGCTGTYDAAQPITADTTTTGAARDIYLHGYVSSRIMRLSNDANGYSDAGEGLPVTVSATLVDGLVLSLTPNSHSYNYRSAVVHGLANPVTDEPEKLWAMRQITNSVVAGRWEQSRTPPTRTEMTSTQILKVRVVGASGKWRKGGPHDERHDLANEKVVGDVWTGVVPCYEMLGAPVKADTETKTEVPVHITEAVQRQNAEREEAALKNLVEPVKK